MIGETISHYRIEEKLGEGGMGVVYKARDTKLDRTVALKFLPSHLGTDETEKQRFLNEAKAASALDHTNICSIYSIEETDDGNLFIVMAYYEGMSLKEKIEQGPLSFNDVANYAIQIASGLQKAHEKGIVHRDLKPENIFITEEDQVKIIDFGLAKAAQRTMLTKSGTTLGTVQYMSPEQAQGDKVDHRTDVWSLGVVMYEMLTGQLPFKSEYETALVYSIINEDPKPVTGLRSGVPMELERIINKCLEKVPEDRYQQTNDLIVDIRKVERELSSGLRSKAPLSGRGEKTHASMPEEESSSGSRPDRNKIKPFLYSIPVVLILLIGLYLFLPERTTVPELDNSIAVLPLENLSPDPGDAFFTDGMHDDIIIQLSKIGDIRVIGRGSVAGYKPGERNYHRIGEELGVSSLLEGTVRRAGDRVRVSVNLIDAETNESLWADSYDRELIDHFYIQSEIAEEIVAALQANLTPDERDAIATFPTDSPKAYDYYLQGRQYYNRPVLLEENYQIAEELYERAIGIDPEFGLAYAALSLVHSSMYWFAFDKTEERLMKAQDALDQALHLNPDHPDVLIARGTLYYWGYRNYQQALEQFEKAQTLLPNYAEIYMKTGAVQRRLGLWDEARNNFHKAVELEPRKALYRFELANTYFYIRSYEEALKWYNSALSLSPDLRQAEAFKALIHVHVYGTTEPIQDFLDRWENLSDVAPYAWFTFNYFIRNFDEILHTIQEIDTPIIESPWATIPLPTAKGVVYDALGKENESYEQYDSARVMLKTLINERPDDHRIRIALGRVYAGLGNEEDAVREANKAMEILPIEGDAMDAPYQKYQAAIIFAKVGQKDNAIDLIEQVLELPNQFVSRNYLRKDPNMDILRDEPRFQRLVEHR